MRRCRVRRGRPRAANTRRDGLLRGVPRRPIFPGGAVDADRSDQPGDGAELPGRARAWPAEKLLMTPQRDVFRLDGRSALVTGAGSGVGEAIAHAFSAAGAAVMVSDIDKDAAVATAESISAAGGTAQPFVLDVRNSAAAKEAAGAAAELGGGTLNILVNNAGAIAPAMFADLSEEKFRRIIDIHLVASFVCS